MSRSLSSFLCIIASWLVVFLLCPGQIVTEEVTLGITQWGDTRLMYDVMEAGNLPNPCSSGQKCVGGIPLLMSYINYTQTNYLKDVNQQLSIATGNLVSGESGYLSLLGWEKFGLLLSQKNLYQPNFMSLGIKEFEAGLSVTNDYLKPTFTNIKTIITNVNCEEQTGAIEQVFCGTYTINNIIYHELKGVSIGIVGFLNPLVNQLGDAGNLNFTDPADAIAKALESDPLKSADFVIAIGTGTNDISKSIIDKSGGKVKLVIYGGGSLTGNYPMSYKDAFIATTGSKYGTRVGALKLTIDTTTKAVTVDGHVRDVDSVNDLGIVSNQDATKTWSELVKNSKGGENVVLTRVKLDGTPCWSKECNLGNLVTDAMVHCAQNYKGDKMSDSDLNVILKGPIMSIWHGGALLKDDVEAENMVKRLDVHKWLPYHNKAYLVRITGSTLRKLFETSSEGLQENPLRKWGQFLQVSSGMEIVYNDRQLSRIRTVHLEDGIPTLKEIGDENEYFLVIPSIIYKQKSVWDYMTKDRFKLIPIIDKPYLDIGYDDDCLLNYLKTSGTVSTGFDERMFLSDQDSPSSGGGSCKKNTGLTVFLTLLITTVIIGLGWGCWRFIIKPRRANNNCL